MIPNRHHSHQTLSGKCNQITTVSILIPFYQSNPITKNTPHKRITGSNTVQTHIRHHTQGVGCGSDRLNSGPVLQMLVLPTQPRGGSVMFSFSNSSWRDWATTATASVMWADSFFPLISWSPSRPGNPHHSRAFTLRWRSARLRDHRRCQLYHWGDGTKQFLRSRPQITAVSFMLADVSNSWKSYSKRHLR